MNRPRAYDNKARHYQNYKLNERKIQKAILKLVIAHRGRITSKQLSKETKLSRQTVFAHYPTLEEAPNDIEQKTIKDFVSEIDNQIRSLETIIKNQNERIFYAVFVFMSKRKELFFQICVSVINQSILYKMIEYIYPKIRISWFPINSPKPIVGSDKADMYICMVVEIIRKWGVQTQCDLHKSRRYIRRLIKLTSEASVRCK